MKVEIAKQFLDRDLCWHFFESVRWERNISCVICSSTDIDFTYRQFHYRCNKCNDVFNAITGSLFDRYKVSLITWMALIHYYHRYHKEGYVIRDYHKLLGIGRQTLVIIQNQITKSDKEGGFESRIIAKVKDLILSSVIEEK